MSHANEWSAPGGGFKRKIKGLFWAVGDVLREVARGEGAPNMLVLASGDFLRIGKGEGEVD